MTPRDTRPLVLAAALLWGAAAVSPAAAQDPGPAPSSVPPPAVAWEPVGLDSFKVVDLLVARGPAPDGSLDTLYTADYSGPPPDYAGPHRLPPGGEWGVLVCVRYTAAEGCGPRVIERTNRGALLIGGLAGIIKVDRLPAPGERWEFDVLDEYVNCLYAASADFGHAVFACERNGPVWTSPDGAPGTWEPLGLPDADELGRQALSLAEALPGPALPGPRLVAAVASGMAYSDDGGRTWTRSSLWQAYRYLADGGVARLPVPGHPYGGVLYAGVRDLYGSYPAVYASEDGGATWAVRSTGPEMTEEVFHRGVVAVDTAGGVWLGIGRSSGTTFTTGSVLWSGDGARTWARVSEGLVDAQVNDVVVGRDGRVYAATQRGVWRTTAPVYAVASESAPEAAGTLALTVRPNPSTLSTEVVVRLGAAPAEAVVTVSDARGREVARLGGAVAGERAWRLDTSGWSAGVYVVQVTVGTEAASAAFTIAR